MSDKEVQSRTMSKKKTIRFSDDLNDFLEGHAKDNKRSFSKTVEHFIELGKAVEFKTVIEFEHLRTPMGFEGK